MQNAPERLFADNEVIDLCQSVINIHRALSSLARFYDDLEDPVFSGSEGSKNGFILWGLNTVAERFLTDQTIKLNRMLEIYQLETARIIRRTERR